MSIYGRDLMTGDKRCINIRSLLDEILDVGNLRQRLDDWWQVCLWHAGHMWCMLHACFVESQHGEIITVLFLAHLTFSLSRSLYVDIRQRFDSWWQKLHLYPFLLGWGPWCCQFMAEAQWLVTSLSLMLIYIRDSMADDKSVFDMLGIWCVLYAGIICGQLGEIVMMPFLTYLITFIPLKIS